MENNQNTFRSDFNADILLHQSPEDAAAEAPGIPEVPTAFTPPDPEAAPASGNETKKRKRSPVRAFFSGLLDFLLILPASAALLGTLISVVFRTLAEELNFPSVLGYGADQVKDFFASVYPLLFSSVLFVLILLLVILKNHKSVRRIFLVIGIICVLTAVLCLALGFSLPLIVRYIPSEFSGLLIMSMNVFTNLLFVSALCLLIISSIMFTLFMMIRFVQKEKEKRHA